jgi:DnaJ-class molecular chaperone
MSDIERDLVDGFTEFTDKLKGGEPIEATRLQRCTVCDGLGYELTETDWVKCWTCANTGFVSTDVTLNPTDPAN